MTSQSTPKTKYAAEKTKAEVSSSAFQQVFLNWGRRRCATLVFCAEFNPAMHYLLLQLARFAQWLPRPIVRVARQCLFLRLGLIF